MVGNTVNRRKSDKFRDSEEVMLLKLKSTKNLLFSTSVQIIDNRQEKKCENEN